MWTVYEYGGPGFEFQARDVVGLRSLKVFVIFSHLSVKIVWIEKQPRLVSHYFKYRR
jgi:hypothetical protein